MLTFKIKRENESHATINLLHIIYSDWFCWDKSEYKKKCAPSTRKQKIFAFIYILPWTNVKSYLVWWVIGSLYIMVPTFKKKHRPQLWKIQDIHHLKISTKWHLTQKFFLSKFRLEDLNHWTVVNQVLFTGLTWQVIKFDHCIYKTVHCKISVLWVNSCKKRSIGQRVTL